MDLEKAKAELSGAQEVAVTAEAKVRELKAQIETHVQKLVAAGGRPNRCCNIETNLFVDESPRLIAGQMGGKPVTATVTVRKCKVCNARHHEVTAEAGHFGVKGANVR